MQSATLKAVDKEYPVCSTRGLMEVEPTSWRRHHHELKQQHRFAQLSRFLTGRPVIVAEGNEDCEREGRKTARHIQQVREFQ